MTTHAHRAGEYGKARAAAAIATVRAHDLSKSASTPAEHAKAAEAHTQAAAAHKKARESIPASKSGGGASSRSVSHEFAETSHAKAAEAHKAAAEGKTEIGLKHGPKSHPAEAAKRHAQDARNELSSTEKPLKG